MSLRVPVEKTWRGSNEENGSGTGHIGNRVRDELHARPVPADVFGTRGSTFEGRWAGNREYPGPSLHVRDCGPRQRKPNLCGLLYAFKRRDPEGKLSRICPSLRTVLRRTRECGWSFKGNYQQPLKADARPRPALRKEPK